MYCECSRMFSHLRIINKYNKKTKYSFIVMHKNECYDNTDIFTTHKQFTYQYFCTNVLIVNNIISYEHKISQQKSFPVIVRLFKPIQCDNNIMVMKVWITKGTKVKELMDTCNNYISENTLFGSCYYKHKRLDWNQFIFNESDKITELKIICNSFGKNKFENLSQNILLENIRKELTEQEYKTFKFALKALEKKPNHQKQFHRSVVTPFQKLFTGKRKHFIKDLQRYIPRQWINYYNQKLLSNNS
eukprot:554183_1